MFLYGRVIRNTLPTSLSWSLFVFWSDALSQMFLVLSWSPIMLSSRFYGSVIRSVISASLWCSLPLFVRCPFPVVPMLLVCFLSPLACSCNKGKNGNFWLLFSLKVGPFSRFSFHDKLKGETKAPNHFFPHYINLCVLELGVGSFLFFGSRGWERLSRTWRGEWRLPYSHSTIVNR